MPETLDQQQRQPLTASDAKTPDIGAAPSPAQSPPPVTISQSPVPAASSRHRVGYARTPSVSFIDERLLKPAMESLDEDEDRVKDTTTPSHGLGIEVGPSSAPKTPPSQTMKRTPVGSKIGSEQTTPESGKALLSPASTAALSGSTRFGVDSFEDVDVSYGASPQLGKQSYSSLNSINAPSVSQTSERTLLRRSAAALAQEQYDNDFSARHVCSSAKHFRHGMNNWLAITIVALSVFSTFFSGAYLVIALRGPRYDMVGKNGSLTISSAAFLTSFFAKMIELSFVTVVVAFIGQSLARKAYKKETQSGVTLAEISMRSWIVQPGTMFTHWESVRYAAPTWLGLIALVSAVMAMLYTSAATALVQPQLKFSGWERRALQGPVMSEFANSPYLEKICKSPITYIQDGGDTAVTEQTCISNEHAAQAFHNYFHWIGHWTDVAFSGNGTRDLSTRPPGWALFNDNTTITAPWINQRAPYMWSKHTGWFIHNISMAMPHPGVTLAAVDPANHIPQPDELNGLGIYSIRASVPSPFVNVLCAMGMSKSELKPLIYESWDNATRFDASNWPAQLGETVYDYPYLGGTPFDDIFLWGEKYGTSNWPPVFPKLPKDYNTIINDTSGVALWGRTAIYVLGKGGDVDAIGTPTEDNYALCQLQVGQTPDCSTQYNASSSVGTLEAICQDSGDDMRYIRSMRNATGNFASLTGNWPDIASMWARSLDLNTGIFDSNGTNSRLLTELILTNASMDWATGQVQLDNGLPSPAEALAVMSGCTLLQSAQDAPFVEFWNYSSSYLNAPQIQWFNATIRAQQYASGGIPGYQKSFFVVLFLVFSINVFIFACWLIHREWYVDFSDPTHLFTLAINSPPSKKLADCSCVGVQHSGERYKYEWKVENHDGHVIMESPDLHEMDDLEESPDLRKRKRFSFPKISPRRYSRANDQ